jgi:Homeobox KN domain
MKNSTVSTATPVVGRRASIGSPSCSDGPKRKPTSLPLETVEYLKAWMMSPEHIAHPYPTDQEKWKIIQDTGIEMKQLVNWFVNNRKRYWKPRVENQDSSADESKGTGSRVSASKNASAFFKSDLRKAALPLSLQLLPSVPSIQVVSSASLVSLDPPAAIEPGTHGFSTTSIPQYSSLSVLPTHDSPDRGSAVVSLSASPARQELGSPHFRSTLSRLVSEHGLDSETSSVSSNNEGVSDTFGQQQSVSSFSDSSSNCITTEEIGSDGIVTRTEDVSVHILRPMHDYCQPSLEDVTILNNVPEERILRSFPYCALTYRFPVELSHDARKVRNLARVRFSLLFCLF